MPCKSVVFLTDSYYIHKVFFCSIFLLNFVEFVVEFLVKFHYLLVCSHVFQVEFEQMRGRAGRRGFDHAGNTVFCYFSPARIAFLLLSPMQPLLAIPALNIDSILRAIVLQSKVSDKASVSRYLSSLSPHLHPLAYLLFVTPPLPSYCPPILTIHFRSVGRWLYTHPTMGTSKETCPPPAVFLFSIELLFRLHLINKQVYSYLLYLYSHLLFPSPSLLLPLLLPPSLSLLLPPSPSPSLSLSLPHKLLQSHPIGLSGLVAHNFDVYPANYAVAYLIQGSERRERRREQKRGEESRREQKRGEARRRVRDSERG